MRLIKEIIFICIVFWLLYVLSPWAAEAQNIPTGPRGCFVLEGEAECYDGYIDCGNILEDVQAYGGVKYLASIFGKTVASTCWLMLQAEDELESAYQVGFEDGEESFKSIARLRLRKIRKLKRRMGRCHGHR